MINYIFVILLFFSTVSARNYITYTLNGGRFGDCLSTVCKALWYAYRYDLTLLYKEFEYSNQLRLHQLETPYNDEIIHTASKIVKVKTEDDIRNNNKQDAILFVSDFYSITPGLYEYSVQDPVFAQILKNALTPIIPLPTIQKEPDTVTVAVHVRKGGGFDQPLFSVQIYKKPGQPADKVWPTKFPPDQFYIDQIITLKKLISPKKMIVYFLTDDPNPHQLVVLYQSHINDPEIQFIYREHHNSHNANVIEDFCTMAQCECLIRSTSLYAKAAQLLGSHAIIMYPINGYWQENKLIINPIGIIIRETLSFL